MKLSRVRSLKSSQLIDGSPDGSPASFRSISTSREAIGAVCEEYRTPRELETWPECLQDDEFRICQLSII